MLAKRSSTLAGAATVVNTEATIQSVVAGGYVEQQFALNDRLFLTGALRADGRVLCWGASELREAGQAMPGKALTDVFAVDGVAAGEGGDAALFRRLTADHEPASGAVAKAAGSEARPPGGEFVHGDLPGVLAPGREAMIQSG